MSMAPSRAGGLAIVLVATLLWSSVGLFVRMAALDAWSVVLWRGVFAILALAPFWLIATRNKTAALRRTLSKAGLVAVVLAVIGNIGTIGSLSLTSVATVMTVYATLPFITAAIAFFALGEPMDWRFGAAAALATAGIAITAGAAISVHDLGGIAVALIMTASWAGLLVQTKKHPSLDLTLISLLSALAGALVALPMVPFSLPAPQGFLACALLGVLTSGLANVLTLVGGRSIRSGEAGFLLLLDVVLGPLWVWLAFGEEVGLSVLLGGALVVAAVAGYLISGTSRRIADCPTG